MSKKPFNKQFKRPFGKPAKKPDKTKVRGYIYRNLAMREWARKMLYQKAVAKFDDPKMVNDILDEFEEQDILSDKRFAEAYIRSARDYRGYGPTKTKMRLLEKGVNSSLFSEYLAESHDIWTLRCHVERKKKYGAMPETMEEKSKQYKFLQQRGFRDSQIKLSFKEQLPFDPESVELPEFENQDEVSIEEMVSVLNKASNLK